MLFFQSRCHYTLSNSMNVQIILVVIGMLFSILTNSLLLYAVFRRSANRSKFYLIIKNIGISDFLTGTVAAPYFIYLYCRYTKYKTVDTMDSIFLTIFFTVAASAILNCSFMAVDRLTFLRNPEIYTSSLNNRKQTVIIVLIWISSFCFSLIQHVLNQLLYQTLFSILVVFTSGIIMIFTLIAYWKHFSTHTSTTINKIPSRTKSSNLEPPPKETIQPSTSIELSPHLDVFPTDLRKPSDTPSVATIPGTTDDFMAEEFQVTTIRPSITELEHEKPKKHRSYEIRIVLTLTIMTATYWLFHLPFIISSLYLYACEQCPCDSLVASQCVILYTVLFSSGFRPLIFIIRLSQTREAICQLFDQKQRRRRHYTLEREVRS